MRKVVDLHCDTILEIWNSELRGDRLSLRDTEKSGHPLHIDLKKLKEGNYLLQNFALFTDLRMPKPENRAARAGQETGNNWKTPAADPYRNAPGGNYLDPWTQVTEMIRVFQEEIAANADRIRQVRTWKEIEENSRNGLICALLTTEEGGILQGDLDRLDTLYEAGVRMMTITWNYDNELGHPNVPPRKEGNDFRYFFRFKPQKGNGLTSFGKEAVTRMEELHILPDVSHLSDAGFYDVAELVKGPFVASHSNARALCGCSRNLTDDMIREIGRHGGLIGLNFCPSFLMEADNEQKCRSRCEDLARHARYIMDKGGKEIIALGTDFDGIAPQNLDIENASRIQKLAEYMEQNGFTSEEIDGIYYRNALRLYKEVL